MPAIVTPATYLARKDHTLKFAVGPTKSSVDSYKYSFFPRTIRIWNHLPGEVVYKTGLPAFKEAALPIIRNLQPPTGSLVL